MTSLAASLRNVARLEKLGDLRGAQHALLTLADEYPGNRQLPDLMRRVLERRFGAPAQPFTQAHVDRLLGIRSAFGLDAAIPDAAAFALANPRSKPARLLLARAYAEAEVHERAMLEFQRLRKDFPTDEEVVTNLAAYFNSNDECGKAIELLQGFLQANPPSYMLLMSFAGALNEKGAYLRAARAAEQAQALAAPESVQQLEARELQGVSLIRDGQVAEGRAILEGLFGKLGDDDRLKMAIALGDLSLDANDTAIEVFEERLRANPLDGAAWYSMAQVVKFRPGDPRIAQMEAALADPKQDDHGTVLLHFALSKAYQDAKSYDVSFAHLAKGNSQRRATLDYSAEDVAQRFARLRATFTAATPRARPTPLPVTPIFVLGMMRSGTTLTEQILSSHSQVTGCGELETLNMLVTSSFKPGRPQEEALTMLREGYLSELAERAEGRPYAVDKMPANFAFIGVIRKAMPEAKIIHLVRDPMAVCWSIYQKFFPARSLGYAFDIGELIQFYDQYAAHMDFMRAEFAGEFLDLDYKRLTDKPEETIRALLDYCGLLFEEACLAPQDNRRSVRTASQQQVRQPIYTGSTEAWRRFEAHLGELMAHFGVEPAAKG